MAKNSIKHNLIGARVRLLDTRSFPVLAACVASYMAECMLKM